MSEFFNSEFYKSKSVLVTGGTGLIGRPLVEMLVQNGAKVTVVSLDDPSRAPDGVNFVRADLREKSNCVEVCEGKDIVFHLAGVKSSPKMTAEQPASFFVNTISFNTNMMEAARLKGVERYLYTSSIGVYAPAEVFYEDDVWKTFPSPNDRFAGWAKRMGELQAEAYKIEHGWDKVSIARPANVYGIYDNFDPRTSMVIPGLIKRAVDGEDPLVVWGDGSPIRDFINAKDVARGMLMMVEKGVNAPVNLGSGTGVTIKEIAETIVRNLPGGSVRLEWDTTKHSGDAKRLMDITRANLLMGFKPKISLEDGIKEVIDWYSKNKDKWKNQYNAFDESKGFIK